MPVTNAGGSSLTVSLAASRLSTSPRADGSLPHACERKALRPEGGRAAASWNNSSILGQFLDMELITWSGHSPRYAICLQKTPHRATLIPVNGELGGSGDTDTLLHSVYDELRRLAAYQLNRERPNHTLQATALVHEAYLRLAAQEKSKWSGRVHFISMASEMMRRVLVDYAREHLREKRGGGLEKLSLSEAAELVGGRDVELLDLDRALGRLAERSE